MVTSAHASEVQAGAVLEIDLEALAANYEILKQRAAPAECAAVVKADAYGLGAERVGPVLAAAGCETFFVAHLSEAIALRRALGVKASIYVLNGILPGMEDDFTAHDLRPVLNTLEQLDLWPGPAALHLDTGMNRLGLSPEDVAALAAAPERLRHVDLRCIISHLACADQADHAMNDEQRQLFDRLRAKLPGKPASLANSSGIFLGPDYHHDLVRPGVALYGANPTPGAANPMREVVRLKGRIIQVREIDTPQSVGYGATHRATGPRRIATVPVGYADGYLRSLSGQGVGCLAGVSVPIVGRVSMDLITLDVTEVPGDAVHVGALVELIGGGGPTLDEIAEKAGTIGYEILTSLGRRYQRQYLKAGKQPR
ncbi:MAG: alanine racemase [Alphaproteobacteria bacterium]|jgi:alanine racemase|nr:alanine racemase [Alphaproteobacteria bacterium]MDP6829542.1 alanine racemase [Alphaproteobacteria bacterium]MDP6872461.1 alanine racemase [Alphaproteobacteria bacterium]